MARDLCCVPASVLGWSLILNNQRDSPSAHHLHAFLANRNKGDVLAPRLDSAGDFLAPRGVCMCRETVSLGGGGGVLSMFTVSPQRIRVYTAPYSVTVGLVPRGKLQNCCEIGKDFVLNRVFLLLYAKLESAAEIGSVRYFFGCHILGRKTVRSHSHFTNPPPPLLVLYDCSNHCVYLFLAKEFSKREPRTFCPR